MVHFGYYHRPLVTLFSNRRRLIRFGPSVWPRREGTLPMLSLTANVRPVPEQISELKNEYPRSIALSHGDRQLSFEELDSRADRFAGYLSKLGVECGGTVAICMERSFEWIVA